MRPRDLVLALTALAVACAGGCGSSSSDEAPAEERPSPPVTVRMDFARAGSLFDAPFPSDDLLLPDGKVAIDRFPNPSNNPFVAQLTKVLAADARGFATTAGVFASLTGPVDPASLPDLAASVTPAASVALIGLDDGTRWPIHVAFEDDAGPFGAANMLSAVPLQGIALPPKRTFGLAITSRVRDTKGRPLAASDAMRSIAHDGASRWAPAVQALAKAGVAADDLAGLAVFTTGDPTEQMISVTKAALAAPPPALAAAPKRGEVFDAYCVYNAQLTMPDYQAGAPPYAREGGGWALDAAGRPIAQRAAAVRVVLTVPRAPAPARGYPLAVMIRTGGGGDRPLVDRGAQNASGAALEPGSGPARELAKIGFAGASADGPHAGPRNPTNGDEQFLMFNVENVTAIRDNVRESALETAVFARVLETLSFDASDCPGASPTARFDTSRMALMGHSMGATIAPLALAAEPKFRAAVLGGAGASWIENVLFKLKPLAVRPIVEILLGYRGDERTLHRGDPVLTLIQWALEPADPLVYDRLLVAEPRAGEAPRHVLVQQGIVDHYIMPTIANAMTLSMGLDLAGDALDATSAELRANAEHTPLADVLPFARRRQIALPASGNAGAATAVVRQYAEDGVQDGHEVMFQTEPPKAEYRCFLLSLAKGKDLGRAPVVANGACPADAW
jgi:hypothetical protein